MGALFRKPLTWLIIAFTCLPCLCLVTMPLWLSGGYYALVPFANAVRVKDVVTHKYIEVGDTRVVTCDDPICDLEFEGQEALTVTKGQSYIEFTISNASGQRLEEQFTIEKVMYTNGFNAVCTYYPFPQVVGGQMSTIRCVYPAEKVDQVCLILDFPEVHPTLVGKEHLQTEICRNIDGGK